MRPIIGITTYVSPASWGVWHDLPTALIPHDYAAAVRQAGGRAVLLPPDDQDADVLGMLDGLVLAGGPDVGPALYGAEAEPLTETHPERDSGEMTLVHRALEIDLPILGVCRGMQLLTVAAGGRLHQHLPDVVGHEGHAPGVGVLMGDDTAIHCYHHQGVAHPGTLTVTGSTADGTVETVEDPDRRFLLGVQWHPELIRDRRLFGALVAAAEGIHGATTG